MEARRVEGFAEGTLPVGEMTAEEAAVEELVGKSVEAPARLEPRDLAPLVREIGLSGALEIVAVIGAFHYINRIAEMVGIESWLPRRARGWRWLRHAAWRLQSRLVAWGMDFSALAGLATRQPSAVTAEMVDAVRRRHRWTDAQLTDLFYLIAVRNNLERFDRWLAEPVS